MMMNTAPLFCPVDNLGCPLGALLPGQLGWKVLVATSLSPAISCRYGVLETRVELKISKCVLGISFTFFYFRLNNVTVDIYDIQYVISQIDKYHLLGGYYSSMHLTCLHQRLHTIYKMGILDLSTPTL